MVALQKAIEDQGGSGSGGMETSIGLPMRQQPHNSIINTGGTSINNDKSSVSQINNKKKNQKNFEVF